LRTAGKTLAKLTIIFTNATIMKISFTSNSESAMDNQSGYERIMAAISDALPN
jgi:hypothetical protein